MKYLALILGLLTFSTASQAQQKFTVKGTVAKDVIADSVRIQVENPTGGYKWETIPVTKGKFAYSGEVDRPRWTFFSLVPESLTGKNEDDLSEAERKADNSRKTMFYLDGNITIDWKVDTALIQGGGPEQQLWSNLDFSRFYSGNNLPLIRDYVRQHPDNYVSLDLINMFLASVIDVDNFESVYQPLSPRMKATREAQRWMKDLAEAKKTAVGKPSIDFGMPDVNGKEVKLSDYRGKYVLLDFWASWCFPCRATHPGLVKAFREYKDENFDVLSVSLDENRDAWLKAIKDDSLSWTQVSDLQGAKSSVAKAYNITSIPRNFLIGPDGVIVGRDLHNEHLTEMLSKLLKNPVNSGSTDSDDDYLESIDKMFADFEASWNGKNRPAIDFTAYDVNSKPVKLSDFKDKVVIVDFWYTACHMCIKGFPKVHRIAEKYADQDVVVLAACMPEKKADFERFVKANKASYPKFIWLQDRSAEKMDDGVAIKEYGIIGAPTQVVINKAGRVVSAGSFYDQLLTGLSDAGVRVDSKDVAEAAAERAEIEARKAKIKRGENVD